MLYAKVVTIRDAQVPASPLALAPRPHPLTLHPAPRSPLTTPRPHPRPHPHPEQVNEKKVIEKERQEEARRPRYSEM